MSESNGGPRKTSRPTNHERIDNDRKVKECFLQGLSAAFAIQQTRLNKKTVYAKYKKLAKMVEDNDNTNFLERYEEKKSQHIQFLDNLTVKAFKVLSSIEHKIEESKEDEIPVHLLQAFTSIMNSLISIAKERNHQSLKPKLEENLKIKIRKELEENG